MSLKGASSEIHYLHRDGCALYNRIKRTKAEEAQMDALFNMSALMREFTGVSALTVVFLVAAGLLIYRNHAIERKPRNVFLACVGGLVLIAVADWFTYLTNGTNPQLAGIHTVLLANTFAVAPAIPIWIANTIMPERYIRWIMAFIGLHAVFQLVGIFGGYVFWVDDDNVYHRGPLYPAYMVAYSVTSLYLVIESVRAGRAYQTVYFSTVMGILICMLTGVLIQVADANVRTTWPAVSMAVILYFIFYIDLITRTDALTKLLNRRSFDDVLSKPPLPCVAVVIDVNDFKHVNDTYGHAYGDECLARVAQMIRRAYGNTGLCYRTGGDEFAVIMTKRLDDADLIAAEVVRAASNAHEEDHRMPGVSVGYSLASADCDNIDAVFNRADAKMYDSKAHKE